MRLRDLGTDRLTWRDLFVVVSQAPRDSAIVRAMDQDAHLTVDTLLLRAVEYAVRVNTWARTKDAQRATPQHRPDPIPVSAREIAAYRESLPDHEKVDRLPMTEMAAVLGGQFAELEAARQAHAAAQEKKNPIDE